MLLRALREAFSAASMPGRVRHAPITVGPDDRLPTRVEVCAQGQRGKLAKQRHLGDRPVGDLISSPASPYGEASRNGHHLGGGGKHRPDPICFQSQGKQQAKFQQVDQKSNAAEGGKIPPTYPLADRKVDAHTHRNDRCTELFGLATAPDGKDDDARRKAKNKDNVDGQVQSAITNVPVQAAALSSRRAVPIGAFAGHPS